MARILLLIFAPIILLVGGVLKGLYRLFFSWWLEPLTGQKLDRQFAEEIRTELPFLFEQRGGRLVPSQVEFKRSMDASWATVEVEHVLLLFLRGRGDLTISIAPKHDPSDWHDLSLVAMVVETPQGIRARARCFTLSDVRELLQTHWDSVNAALSAEQYPIIRRRLDEIYDLPADSLWQAGISIPKHLRHGSRAPLPLPRAR